MPCDSMSHVVKIALVKAWRNSLQCREREPERGMVERLVFGTVRDSLCSSPELVTGSM
jgi:hypothetical protein